MNTPPVIPFEQVEKQKASKVRKEGEKRKKKKNREKTKKQTKNKNKNTSRHAPGNPKYLYDTIRTFTPPPPLAEVTQDSQ